MSVEVCYYSVKSATDIAKLALEYRKIQEISRLSSAIENQKNVTESIVSYCSLIRNDVQTIMHMYFKSAFENLKYALNASGENKSNYLFQAKNRFVDAIAVEKNENLILSYLGLALCQSLTDDIENSNITLNKIKCVNSDFPDDVDALCSMLPFRCNFVTLFGDMNMYKLIGKSDILQYGYLSSEERLAYLGIYLDIYELAHTPGTLFLDEQSLKYGINKVLENRFACFKKEIVFNYNL